jgi:hypothetical protein
MQTTKRLFIARAGIHSDRIATIGWMEVARRAAGKPARSAAQTAMVEAAA